MYSTNWFRPPIVPLFRNFGHKGHRASVRSISFLALMALACSVTRAQNIGYVLNPADGNVTIFAVSQNPNGVRIAESFLQTVNVCTAPSNAAVTPDGSFVYVTCSSDNSLWVIDVTSIGNGTVSAHAVAGTQLSTPGGIAIITAPTTGANNGKTLAYIVNSATNTVSVLDVSNNALYDGPIQLGTTPPTNSGPRFAGLVAVSPDASKVFVTTNNSTPQLWMIDTTVKPQTAVQIQAPGIPATATDSLYLSVQESASPSSDYYLFLTSSFPNNLLNPSVLLVDVEPASPAGSLGSPSNALVFTASLDTAQPNHVISLVTDVNGSSQIVNGYTVDPTNLWQVSFKCTPASSGTPDCSEVIPGTSGSPCSTTPCALAKPISEPGSPAPALNGLGITSVPDKNNGSVNIYVTDGKPDGMAQTPVDTNTGALTDPFTASTIQVGNGALPPVFSPLSPASAPIVLFGSLEVDGIPLTSVIPVGKTLTVTGIAFANQQDSVAVSLNFNVNDQLLCNNLPTPCISGSPELLLAGVGGSEMFPASGVYTVILQGTGTNGSGQALTGQATRTVVVGTNCTLSSAGITPAASNIAVDQQVNVSLPCLAPAGDSITGILNWDDGTTPSPPTISPVSVGSGSTATLTFSHHYATPKTYSISVVSLTDTDAASHTSPGNPIGGSAAVIVNPLAVSVSPPAASVQVPSHSVAFAAAVQFDSTNSGVDWALSGSDCSGATCGTLSNVTLTSVTYTAPSVAPASGMVSLTATSKASISYLNPKKSFSVPIKLTALLPPSCTLTAPSTSQTGVSTKADVTCAASAGDSLSATLNWGDGTAAATSTATVGSSGSASFPSFTHTYANASNPSYPITLSVTDSTTGLAGSVTPPSIAISVFQAPAVGPPAAMSTVTVFPGQSVAIPINFSGGAVDAGITFNTISCAVAPAGPVCRVSPGVLTLDNSGNGVVQLTVTTIGPATTSAARQDAKPGWLFSSLVTLPSLGFVFLSLGTSTRKSKWLPDVSYVFLLVGIAVLGAGCGSTTQRSNLACTACTPAGSYTVTVMASSQKPVLQTSGTVSVVVVNH
jgi:hypothetical protein